MADTLAPRPVVAKRYQGVLDECRAYLASFCDTRLDALFKNAGGALLDFAERAQSTAVQSRLFEAISQLNSHRAVMERRFRDALDTGFVRLAGAGPDAAESDSDLQRESKETGELTLLSPEEMEESVAAENLVLRANANCFPELYAVSQRLAVVRGGRKLKEDEIPGGPHHLVHAYRDALVGLDVDSRVKVILYALFDRFVLKQVKSVYEEYNRLLIAAGVLPKLKAVHLRSQSKTPPPGESAEQTPEAANQATEEGDTRSLGAELFDSILEIMSSRRVGRSGPAQAARQPTPEEAGIQTQALLSAISSLQANRTPETVSTAVAEAARFPSVEVDAAFVSRVKSALSEEREQLLRSVDKDKMSPVDADLIDLIGMLFEYMLNDPVLPNLAKALLSHLHTPYLKVALIDRRLLVDSRHPARVLLDQMVDAGSQWVEEGNPARGMFPAMQKIVDRILQELTDDVTLFDELLAFFEEKMREQQRRSETMEERTQEAARGQEKLALAKQRAAQEIQRLVDRWPVPKPVAAFLSKSWLDHLVFVLLRDPDQDQGKAWKQAVAIGEHLVALFDPQASPEQRRVRLANLPRLRDAIAAAAQKAGSLGSAGVAGLLSLLDSPQTWQSQDMERPEIPLPVPSGPAGAPILGSAAASDEDLTEAEREMVERLRKMRFGTWFEFSAADGAVSRIKLSWMSPLTSTCMFVDRSGRQAEIKSLRDLAQEILAGRARVVARPKHPFIDRALMSIRRMLQPDAGATASPAAVADG